MRLLYTAGSRTLAHDTARPPAHLLLYCIPRHNNMAARAGYTRREFSRHGADFSRHDNIGREGRGGGVERGRRRVPRYGEYVRATWRVRARNCTAPTRKTNTARARSRIERRTSAGIILYYIVRSIIILLYESRRPFGSSPTHTRPIHTACTRIMTSLYRIANKLCICAVYVCVFFSLFFFFFTRSSGCETRRRIAGRRRS